MKTLPKLKLAFEPIIDGEYITISPITGWSRYKEWPISKWEQLVAMYPNIHFIQLGLASEDKITGCDHSFMGNSILNSIRLIAHAKMHLGSDSYSNHVTPMVETPAIVLWGSTQCSALGYTENINIDLKLPCSPCFKEDPKISSMSRGPCTNLVNGVHACMAGITVETVSEAIDKLMK